MTGHRPTRHPRRGEHGSAALEAAIGLPAFLLFIALLLFAGRVAIATQAVDSAAAQAARTASIARTQTVAQSTAHAAATSTLADQHVNCTRTTVRLDTRGFTAPVGQPATVTATVTCAVNLADLAVPGIPGTRTVTATASSPLDTYRERR
ncbi:TadE/TadG family type IV pilus assembly protein [Phycicoccus sonneratiae]|uniref:Pilus assembly protein n=1 Tax=Phycicoccus sonneratiae TaxID=2807628 RepID=A0ABS2CT14_9MICO|nr:TadE/TadG family type IV pilus assembly protein [Phycicoccus sonneraticus]MBM6402296.1 pilus assembly protein [Phycicoccus sonneraticus]